MITYYIRRSSPGKDFTHFPFVNCILRSVSYNALWNKISKEDTVPVAQMLVP